MTEIPRAQDQLFDSRQSAREKYAALVVGRPGWGALLQHELITLLAQSVPVLRIEVDGDVIHAARAEMARSVDDVLSRRTRARLLDRDCALDAAPEMTAITRARLCVDATHAHARGEVLDADRVGRPGAPPRTRPGSPGPPRSSSPPSTPSPSRPR